MFLCCCIEAVAVAVALALFPHNSATINAAAISLKCYATAAAAQFDDKSLKYHLCRRIMSQTATACFFKKIYMFELLFSSSGSKEGQGPQGTQQLRRIREKERKFDEGNTKKMRL